MNVSNRAQQLTPSVTLAAAAKAKALKAKGVDVLSLTVGEPDFVTPKNIQKAAIASIEDGRASYYTPSGGIPELKQAIVSYVEREYQLCYQPKQVIVTDGDKYALYLLFQAILNVGNRTQDRSHAFHCKIFALNGDKYRIACRHRVDRKQSERGWAVQNDVVVKRPDLLQSVFKQIEWLGNRIRI